jgi:ATP-binding cassette subfamily B protein
MRRRWRLILHVARMTVRTDRRTTVLLLLLILAQALVVAMTGVSQRWLIDAGTAGRGRAVAAAVVLGAVAYAISAAGGRVQNNMQLYLNARVAVGLTAEVLGTVARVPTVAHLERAEELDRVTRLSWRGGMLAGLPWAGVGAVAAGLSLLASITLLVLVHPLLAVLAVLAVPPMVASLRANRIIRDAQDACTEMQRTEQRLHQLCTQAESARELYLTGGGAELDRRADALRTAATELQFAAHGRALLRQGAGWLIYLAGFVGALLLVYRLIGRGTASLGDAVLVFTVTTQLQGQVRLVVEQFRRLAESGNVIDDYWWLRDRADGSGRPGEMPPARIRDGIELDRVSFRYPGARRDALHEVTLRLPAGATIALVGDNGAGKSTLVNLLTGVYEPTDGAVRVDGRPLAELDLPGWQHGVSGVPQDFARIQFVVRETVGVGDLPRLRDEETVRTAVRRAGAGTVVAGLPDDLETQLGRAFGGAEPSPGQWQRLALARALMRPRPRLVVLDEPSAALDPQAEYELFQSFAEQVRAVTDEGGIALLVSHRLSTVRMAGLIVVLRAGRIAEIGTHAELLAADGEYAEMFRLQHSAFHGEAP